MSSRRMLLALLVLVSWTFPTLGAAREQRSVPAQAQTLLQQADAAYGAGERERAQRLYRSVLAADPDNTRAVFQLARLAPEGSAQAIALFRRYVAFEPGDVWGRMALADALAKSGAEDVAIQHYYRARNQAPGEPDVYLGLGRLLRDAGRTDELIVLDEQWVSHQPKNPVAWLELGRTRQKAQRLPEAAEAYALSLASKPDGRTHTLLDTVLAESAPALRPYTGRSSDSDDNRITRYGLDGDWQFTQRSRLGLHVERADVTDPFTSGTSDEFALKARWQPLARFKLDGMAGIAQLQANQLAQPATTHALRQLRLRWNSPAQGPSLDFRFKQSPLIATPGLLAQPVDLSEIKGGVEVPLAGALRARLRGQSGRLNAASDVNQRSGYQLGPVFRLQPAAEIGLSYSELAYDHASTAGYFAPSQVQTVEIGTYLEVERLWPITFALDAGLGQQRVTKQGEATGNWIAAFRWWAMVTWALKPGARLELELEHNDSPVASDAATPSLDWRSNSVMLSLRFSVWPKTARSFLTKAAVKE